MKNSETLLSSIEDIVNYAKAKTIFEVQADVNGAFGDLRSAEFNKNSDLLAEVTKDLSLTKFKLDRLKKKTEQLPKEYEMVISPLINEFEKRVKELRQRRGHIS